MSSSTWDDEEPGAQPTPPTPPASQSRPRVSTASSLPRVKVEPVSPTQPGLPPSTTAHRIPRKATPSAAPSRPSSSAASARAAASGSSSSSPTAHTPSSTSSSPSSQSSPSATGRGRPRVGVKREQPVDEEQPPPKEKRRERKEDAAAGGKRKRPTEERKEATGGEKKQQRADDRGRDSATQKAKALARLPKVSFRQVRREAPASIDADPKALNRTELRALQQKHGGRGGQGPNAVRGGRGGRGGGSFQAGARKSHAPRRGAPRGRSASQRQSSRGPAAETDDSSNSEEEKDYEDEDEEAEEEKLSSEDVKEPPRGRRRRAAQAALQLMAKSRANQQLMVSSTPLRLRVEEELRKGWDRILENRCQVCWYDFEYDDDPIIECDGCNIGCHITCYGLDEVPEGEWNCLLCEKQIANADGGSVRCAICYMRRKGVYKEVAQESRSVIDRGQFAHMACAFWANNCGFEPAESKEEITGTELLPVGLFDQSTVCAVCDSTEGVKLQCYEPHCNRHFHALCGLEKQWIEDYYYWSEPLAVEVVRQDYEFDDKGRRVLKPYCDLHGPVRWAKVATDRSYRTKGEPSHHLSAAQEAKQAAKQAEAEEARRRAEAREEEREKRSVRPPPRPADEDKEEVEVEEKKSAETTTARRVREARAESKEEATAEEAAREKALRKLQQKRKERETAAQLEPAARPPDPVHPKKSSNLSSSTSPAAAELAAKRADNRVHLQEWLSLHNAQAVEEAVFRAFPPQPASAADPEPPLLSSAYNAQIRSLMFNLPRNVQLLVELLQGKVTPAQLAVMTPKEMAGEELQGQRRREQQEAIQEHIRPDEPVIAQRRDGAIVTIRPETLQTVSEDPQLASPSRSQDSVDGSQHSSDGALQSLSQMYEEDELRTEEERQRTKRQRDEEPSVKSEASVADKAVDGSSAVDDIEEVEAAPLKRRRLQRLELSE